MDYAELNKKFSFTDMTISNDNGYITTGDLIADEGDFDSFFKTTLADYRVDSRTMEEDQKQSKTDSVSQLRQQYSGTGLRYGDDPKNYSAELFLEMTEKDPRRDQIDPDYKQIVKQAWARQQMQKINLYPEDPSSGSITQGQKSQYGMTIQQLQGRALSENRYKNLLEDSLDGIEPRRIFRYDNYSYIDKTLANQGDLPYIMQAKAEENVPMHPMAQPPDAPIAGWTDGHLVFNVAQLGRSTGAHISAEDRGRMIESQKHKADPTGAEQGRNEAMTDQNKLYSSAVTQSTNDTIRKIVESTIRAESLAAKSANRGMEWGSVQENVRRAIDRAITQQHMQLYADVVNEKGIRGSTARVNGGAADILAKQTGDTAENSSLNLLARFKDMFNKASLPMSSIVGNTITSEQIKQEVDLINRNWRMELSAGIQKARSSIMDNIQKVAGSAQQTLPWYDHTGRSLEVANYRSMARKDQSNNTRQQTGQQSKFVDANDATGRLRGPGLSSGDTNSMVYAADQGTRYQPEMIAESGSMAGVAAPMKNKQATRFKVGETNEWVADTMDVGEVTGRQYGEIKNNFRHL
jgi:hypothetical protein